MSHININYFNFYKCNNIKFILENGWVNKKITHLD